MKIGHEFEREQGGKCGRLWIVERRKKNDKIYNMISNMKNYEAN